MVGIYGKIGASGVPYQADVGSDCRLHTETTIVGSGTNTYSTVLVGSSSENYTNVTQDTNPWTVSQTGIGSAVLYGTSGGVLYPILCSPEGYLIISGVN